MTLLFYELIRLSIGEQQYLSRVPTVRDWATLYDMAMKQSLTGVCFAGVQRLCNSDEGYYAGMPELQYLTWMGMAAKIQQRNQEVNNQCAILWKRLTADGLRSCILKGQGVAQLYGSLSGLRQSGDIDIWIGCKKDATLDWIMTQGVNIGSIDLVHAHADFFEDTEVEVHSQPSWMYWSKADKVLQRFCQEQAEKQFANRDQKVNFSYPTVGFNIVYLLVHINRHIFEDGIGLRQLMDYYFTLKASTDAQRKEAMSVLTKMGLQRFAGGIMHIERKVFRLDVTYMLCEPNEREGDFLLHDIMIGGNFGTYDNRTKSFATNERWKRGWFAIRHNMRYLTHYPSEVLSIPFWKLWHYCWRKRKGYL
ncbi:MAG: nucleotidyltransferase family protein [Bacteroides sp.]|nr:nucleotidyltransferase family protein [Bacteroides sp.]MCM1447839.1 nucleotidyltransferase family protein [Bacteroides sp.]